MQNRVIKFLQENGYNLDDENSDYKSYNKKGVSSIDVGNDEIVFIDDHGDWLHIPLNYYALIGALIDHRQIAVDYKPVNYEDGADEEEYDCCSDEKKNGWSSHCKTCGTPIVL